MKKEPEEPVSETIISTIGYIPFVNEECGDTMWDEVLKELDEKIKQPEWNGIDISKRF